MICRYATSVAAASPVSIIDNKSKPMNVCDPAAALRQPGSCLRFCRASPPRWPRHPPRRKWRGSRRPALPSRSSIRPSASAATRPPASCSCGTATRSAATAFGRICRSPCPRSSSCASAASTAATTRKSITRPAPQAVGLGRARLELEPVFVSREELQGPAERDRCVARRRRRAAVLSVALGRAASRGAAAPPEPPKDTDPLRVYVNTERAQAFVVVDGGPAYCRDASAVSGFKFNAICDVALGDVRNPGGRRGQERRQRHRSVPPLRRADAGAAGFGRLDPLLSVMARRAAEPRARRAGNGRRSAAARRARQSPSHAPTGSGCSTYVLNWPGGRWPVPTVTSLFVIALLVVAGVELLPKALSDVTSTVRARTEVLELELQPERTYVWWLPRGSYSLLTANEPRAASSAAASTSCARTRRRRPSRSRTAPRCGSSSRPPRAPRRRASCWL